MIKKMLLYFLCFSLFLSIPGCKKKLPTTPDIPTVVLPTIAYFTANPELIMESTQSTLKWSTTNATAISIDQGIGNVDATGFMNVSPFDTTTYTLTAINSDGQVMASCTVEIMEFMALTISVIPESPIFLYDPELNITVSEFTVMMIETNGVGGQVDGLLIEAYDRALPDEPLHAQIFPGGIILPFGNFSIYCPLIILGKPDLIVLWIEATDDNGNTIARYYTWTITWTQNTGTMRFLKIVEGASHHKLIK